MSWLGLGLGVAARRAGAAGGGGSPELVVNGDFDDATGWTLGAGWSISGGVATVDANGDFGYLRSTLVEPVQNGDDYVLAFTLNNPSGVTMQVGTIDESDTPNAVYSGTDNGPVSIPFTASNNHTEVYVQQRDDTGLASVSVDNLSLQVDP